MIRNILWAKKAVNAMVSSYTLELQCTKWPLYQISKTQNKTKWEEVILNAMMGFVFMKNNLNISLRGTEMIL